MHNILDREIKSDANLEGMGTNIMVFKHQTVVGHYYCFLVSCYYGYK